MGSIRKPLFRATDGDSDWGCSGWKNASRSLGDASGFGPLQDKGRRFSRIFHWEPTPALLVRVHSSKHENVMSTTLAPSALISIVLADDHGIVRAGLRALLERQLDMRILGEASDGPEAIRAVRELRPNVLITDLSMPGGGLETIREITMLGLPTRILVLTVHAEERYLLPVLEAGGSGYVRKSSAHTDLLDAVRTVSRGEVFLDPAATKTLLRGYLGRVRTGDEVDFGEVLSDREREVVRLTAEGYTALQASDFLSLSPKTVETYRHRAMQKLGLTNRAELVRYALRSGLLGDTDS